MGALSANQHLRVYVSPEAAPVAKTLDALANGEITFLRTNIAAGVAAIPTAGTFRVAYKDLAGEVHLSDVIDTALIVSKAENAASVDPVEQVDNLTIPSVVVGESYVVKLAVPNYAGLISQNDEVYFYGTYTAKTGDTATIVATALRDSLKKAVDKAAVPFAAISSAAAVLTATGVAQPYVRAKFDARQVNFDLSLIKPEAIAVGKDASSVVPKVGKGTYGQVATAEEFYAGYNSDYANRDADFPANGSPTLAAEAGETYASTTIVFETKRGGANVLTQRQTILCAYKEAP